MASGDHINCINSDMNRKSKETPPNDSRSNCAMFGSIRLLCWQDILLVLSEKPLGSHRVMHDALGKRAKSVCRMSISGLMSLFPTFLCTCSTLILYAREQNTYGGNRKKICLTVNFKGGETPEGLTVFLYWVATKMFDALCCIWLSITVLFSNESEIT